MVEMMHNKPFIYNPAQKTKEQLIAEFVVRKNIFEKIIEELKSSPGDLPPQHYLVAGQRGMGKTTLLLRLIYAIEDEPELKDFLIPVRFSEEQYNIVRLEHLWEETATLLESKNPVYKGLLHEMLAHENEENYERGCFELFEKKLKRHNHRVLLLIDNIGNLFEKFPPLQNNRLREVLMTSSAIQLIGCSSKVLEHTFHYDKPFFEFFNQLKLEPLDQAGTLDLLRALSKEYKQEQVIENIIKNNPERIDVLRRITGGVPRTIVLLFDIFIDRHEGNAFEDLQLLLDEVNSLYKHRMDELKPQQQQIIDTLARAWEPITANEVLKRSKLYRENIKSNQISAQLKQLTENQVTETLEGSGRKQTYRIRERFFNIWYLMRHGRKQNKEEVLWLIKFLEAWCTIKDLKMLTDHQVEYMQSGQYSEQAAYYKALAIYSLDINKESKRKLLEETEKFLTDKGSRERAATIKKYKDELDTTTNWEKINEAFDKKEYDKYENLLLEAIRDKEKDNPKVMFNLAWVYHAVKKDYDKAEQYYLKAIEKEHVDAMINLALLYDDVKKDYDKAEQYYLKAIEKEHAGAMNNLALLYENVKKDYDKAEQYYLKAIEKDDADAMNNLAVLYADIKKDYDKAEQYYLKAIEKNHAGAMFNLALLYNDVKKDYDKAEQYYLKVIEKNHAGAMYNLALLYNDVKKDYDKAEQYYLKAIEKDNNDYKALNNIVFLLLKREKIQEALIYAEKLFRNENFYEYPEKAIFHVRNLLIHKQYNFLLKLYKEENSLLMKHASPLYYVLAYFLKEELPGVYETAGPEIKETVVEIIKSIESV